MLKVVRVIAVGVILFSGGCSDSESQPSSVAEQYWQAVLSGDAEGANSLVGVPSDLELSQMIQPGSDSQVRFGATQVDGGEARVLTTVHWVDNDRDAEFELQTTLIQVDGQWKIDAEKTQYAFFYSVYQSGLKPSEPSNANSQQDQGADAAELKSMVDELGRVNQELEQQSSDNDNNEDVLELLRRLGKENPEEQQKN